ncbi:MAG: VOC family protein [Defluviitaleaceae bacterium]|nr:VOC family protein [Defluviitaleaceae bacterium]
MSQSFTVFINFDGNCKQAVEFYSKVFGVNPGMNMTYANAPADPNNPMPASFADKIMYTDLKIAGANVMFSDVPPDTEHNFGTNIILNISTSDENELRKWFDNLQDGGHIIMPLGETFFAKMYGMVADKFGICWNLLLEA